MKYNIKVILFVDISTGSNSRRSISVGRIILKRNIFYLPRCELKYNDSSGRLCYSATSVEPSDSTASLSKNT